MGIMIGARMGAELAGRIKRFEDPINLTNEDIKLLADIFRKHKHYKKIYIDVNGYFHNNVHTYNGGFPEYTEYEGKLYARLGKQASKYWFQQENRWKAKYMPIPDNDFEIVNVLDREDILTKAANIK